MSNNLTEDEFNDFNPTMTVKLVTKLPKSTLHGNELHEHIEDEDWDELINRVKERKKVIIIGTISNAPVDIELSLEIECPNEDGDIPLFLCLR